MFSYFIIHKPFRVSSQFTSVAGKPGLNDFFKVPKDVYAVGRLDQDSEGLLILTNDKKLNQLLLHPANNHSREYLVQVDGDIDRSALERLSAGPVITVDSKPYKTKACKAIKTESPDWIPERIPPVRFRKNIPTSWISITLTEGKNRQVRKMTAAVGFPTLRLIRVRIENLFVNDLKPGEIQELSRKEMYSFLQINP